MSGYNWNNAFGAISNPMFGGGGVGGLPAWGGQAALSSPAIPAGAANPLGLTLQSMPQANLGYDIETPNLYAPPDLTGGSRWDGLKDWLGNGQNLGVAIQGLGTLTNAWLGYQQLQQAKKQFSFNKEAWQKNYTNSTKNYNTALEDRIRGRTADYAGKEADVQAYLDKNKLGG